MPAQRCGSSPFLPASFSVFLWGALAGLPLLPTHTASVGRLLRAVGWHHSSPCSISAHVVGAGRRLCELFVQRELTWPFTAGTLAYGAGNAAATTSSCPCYGQSDSNGEWITTPCKQHKASSRAALCQHHLSLRGGASCSLVPTMASHRLAQRAQSLGVLQGGGQSSSAPTTSNPLLNTSPGTTTGTATDRPQAWPKAQARPARRQPSEASLGGSSICSSWVDDISVTWWQIKRCPNLSASWPLTALIGRAPHHPLPRPCSHQVHPNSEQRLRWESVGRFTKAEAACGRGGCYWGDLALPYSTGGSR